jgi:hypothetical protein
MDVWQTFCDTFVFALGLLAFVFGIIAAAIIGILLVAVIAATHYTIDR